MNSNILNKCGNWSIIINMLKYRQRRIMKYYPHDEYVPLKTIKYLNLFKYSNKPYFLNYTATGLPFVGRINDYNSLLWLLNENTNKHITDLIAKLTNDDSIIFDVGANIGLTSINISTNKEDKVHIYSFEPIPETFNICQTNINLNKLQNIYLFQYALSNVTDELNITIPIGHSGGASLFINHNSQNSLKDKFANVTVKSIPLDLFVNQNNISKVDLIKIDVEGNELNVLIGAHNVIKRYAPTILYEYNECAAAAGWSYKDVENIIASTGRKYKYSVLQHNGEITSYPPKEGESVDILSECDE